MIAEFTLDYGNAVTISMGQIDYIQPSDEGTLVVTEATSCRGHQEPTSPSFGPYFVMPAKAGISADIKAGRRGPHWRTTGAMAGNIH